MPSVITYGKKYFVENNVRQPIDIDDENKRKENFHVF